MLCVLLVQMCLKGTLCVNVSLKEERSAFCLCWCSEVLNALCFVSANVFEGNTMCECVLEGGALCILLVLVF